MMLTAFKVIWRVLAASGAISMTYVLWAEPDPETLITAKAVATVALCVTALELLTSALRATAEGDG